MGWSRGRCGERQVGYGVPALCDWPGCKAVIDRGLGYACGGEHGEGENSCAGYYCGDHRQGFRAGVSGAVCNDCAKPPSKRRYKALVFGPGPAEQIMAIFDDLCELPDHTSPEDQPDLLMATEDELATILKRHLLGAE